jgi:phosphoglycolate phosphatase
VTVTIRCVVFDFDGTLLRSNRLKKQTLYDSVDTIEGASEVLDALHREGLPGDRYDIFHELCRRVAHLTPEGAAPMTAAYSDLCAQRLVSCEEVPGATKALTALSQAGILMYIASATPQEDLRKVVRGRGIDHFFAEVLGRPTGKNEHLQAILSKHDLSPRELVMVGDGQDDQAAAAAVGSHFIAVLDDPVSTPSGMVHSLNDLHGLLNSLEVLSNMAEIVTAGSIGTPGSLTNHKT